jgi:hypothetical protein
MMELSEDIGHRPMVLIRLNPDANSSGAMMIMVWQL